MGQLKSGMNGFAEGEVKYTASGNRQKASYNQVDKWVYDVWNLVAEDELIIKGFEQFGYINFDGDCNKLHSRIRDTVVNWEVAIIYIILRLTKRY